MTDIDRLRREYHAAKRVLRVLVRFPTLQLPVAGVVGEVRYHDRYIARLEAAYRSAVSLIDYWQALAEKAEAEVALRDRMLRDIIERIALTPERWNGWTTEEVLTDLRARAEKEAER